MHNERYKNHHFCLLITVSPSMCPNLWRVWYVTDNSTLFTLELGNLFWRTQFCLCCTVNNSWFSFLKSQKSESFPKQHSSHSGDFTSLMSLLDYLEKHPQLYIVIYDLCWVTVRQFTIGWSFWYYSDIFLGNKLDGSFNVHREAFYCWWLVGISISQDILALYAMPKNDMQH